MVNELFKNVKDNKNIEVIFGHVRGNNTGAIRLYKKLGFVYKGRTQPNYYYIVNRKRKYRFAYRKDILIKEGYDPSKTERQIMLERKIYRIYDSGNLKFIFKS